MHRFNRPRRLRDNNDGTDLLDASNSLPQAQRLWASAPDVDPAVAGAENWDNGNGVSSVASPSTQWRTQPSLGFWQASMPPASALTPNTSNYELVFQRAGSYVHSSLNTNRPLLHLLIAVLGVFAAFSMYPLVRSGLSGIIGSAPGAEPMPPRADFPSLMRIQTQIRGVLNLSKNAMQAGSMLNSGISAVKDLDHLVRYSYFSCKAKLSGKLQHLISTGEPANGALSKFYLGILQLANTFETLDADALVRVQDIKDSMLPDVASERALFIEYSHMSEEMRIGIRELLTLGQSVLSIFVDMETKLADITTLLINERNILSYEQKLEADKNKNVLSMLWEILYEPGPIIYEQNMQSLRNVTTLADDAKGIISCALTMLQTMEQGLEDSLRQQTDAGRTVEIPWKTQASSIREGKKKLSDAISRVNDQEPVNGEALRDWILQPKKLINLGRLLDLI